jgi:hypothetical protein
MNTRPVKKSLIVIGLTTRIKTGKEENMSSKVISRLIIATALVALVGCSQSDRFAAPDSKILLEKAEGPAAYRQVISPEDYRDVPLPMITLYGTLRKTEGADGCYYLKPFEGEFPHELDFRYYDLSSRVLRTDADVKVFGRFNPNYFSECVGGVVFQVFEITYLKGKFDRELTESTQPERETVSSSYQEPLDSDFVGCCLTYQGIYSIEEQGCPSLKLIEENSGGTNARVIELTFQELENPRIADGSKIEVFGNYRIFEKSPCELGPLFNVIVYKILDSDSTLESPRTEVCLD